MAASSSKCTEKLLENCDPLSLGYDNRCFWIVCRLRHWFFLGSKKPSSPMPTRQCFLSISGPLRAQIFERRAMILFRFLHFFASSRVSFRRHPSSVGGDARFSLVYEPKEDSPAYAQVIVQTETRDQIPAVWNAVDKYMALEMPQIDPIIKPLRIGPGRDGKIEARFHGPDPIVLRKLADKAIAIFREDPETKENSPRLAPTTKTYSSCFQ